jgi:hypothetical protein
MTVKEKYIKLYVKFLKKEKLMNDKILYKFFIHYIRLDDKKVSLPYAWFNNVRGKDLNISDKYLDFIEDVFIKDIMKMFFNNPYTSVMDINELENIIKKEMRNYGVMSFCCYKLHKNMDFILQDFYEL